MAKRLCERSVEFRAVSDDEHGDGRTLEGHAAVFNQPTRIDNWEGRFDEELSPGCFTKTLREGSPIMQWNHGMDPAVGQTPIAAIKDLREDKQGLYVKARLLQHAERVREAIAEGAVKGMSFRFTPVRDEWRDAKGNDVDPDELESLLYGYRSADKDRLPLKRTIREVKLHELGPVSTPAYGGTDVGVRSSDEVDKDRKALIEEYRRTMRSGADDGDGDADDTLEFDHFASDIPVREDGLPAVEDGDYDADEAEGRAAKDPKKPYGEVDYADKGYQEDGKYRYPLDTKDHVTHAWDYINVQKNADKYSAADLKKVKAAIKAAAPKFGIKISDSAGDKSEKKSAEPAGAAREGTPVNNPAEAARQGTSDPSQKNEPRKAVSALKTKDEFEARQAEIAQRLSTIAEETRNAALSDEQQTEWDELTSERAANAKKIENIDERAALLLDKARQPGHRETGDGARGGAPAFHPDRGDIFDVRALRNASSSIAEFERKVDDNARFAVERATYAKTPKGYDGAEPAEAIEDLLGSVRSSNPEESGRSVLAKRILATGSEAYGRAVAKMMASGGAIHALEEDEQRALQRAQQLGTGSSGGFAVPFQLDPSIILTNAGVTNPIRQLARQVQITGKQWEGVTSVGATAVRGAEASTAPDSTISLNQPVVTTNRVQAFIPFTYELEDAWAALRSEITMVLMDAKEREEDSFWTGNGSGTAVPGVISYATASDDQSVSNLVATAGVGAFALQDVYNLYSALNPRWERNASWAAHKAIYNKMRQFDTAGGAALWARIGDGQPPRLMEYPDYRVSAMSNAVSTGNVIMVIGDFSKYLIVDRIGMQVELVPQVFDSANGNRPTGQRGVYAIWMNNGVCLENDAFRYLKVA